MAEEFIEDIIASTVEETAGKQKEVVVVSAKEDVKTEEKANSSEQSADVSKGNALPGVKELAKQLGWREDHTGEDSVDAATYILRSKDIQKSMSQHNKDLKEQLQALNGSVEALKKHNESVYKTEVKKLEAEIASLKKERRSAIELADVDKVESLDKQIEDIQKDINAPKISDQQTTNKVANPVYEEWIQSNDWYLKDDAMAAFADTVAQQYVGAPLERIYAIVRTKVQEVFPEKFEIKSVEVTQDVKQADKVKTPVGPTSPVEGSSTKGNNSSSVQLKCSEYLTESAYVVAHQLHSY